MGVDAAGNVYVTDADINRIQMFTSGGDYITQWGRSGAGNGQFGFPRGVATDAAGNIYVADTGNDSIQKFGALPTPTKATSWGRLKHMYR